MSTYLDVRVTARNDEDLDAFVALCKTIQHLGKLGAHRDIRVSVDGDGSGHMWSDFGDLDTSATTPLGIDEPIVIRIGG